MRQWLSRFREEPKITNTIAVLADVKAGDLDDILVASGDLHITGDLDLADEGAFVLIVDGRLTVDGLYHDSDDPESYLLVTGDMRARDVITAGWLEVHGSLTTGRLIGDYNDCSAHLAGDVHAEFFYGEEHFFTIKGALHAEVIVGSRSRPRLDIAVRPEDVVAMDDPRLLDYFDRELVNVHDSTVDGLNFDALKVRVAAGISLRQN